MQIKSILDVDFKSFVLLLLVLMMLVRKQFILPFADVFWLQECMTHFGCMHVMSIKWIRSWESNSWSCTACQSLKTYAVRLYPVSFKQAILCSSTVSVDYSLMLSLLYSIQLLEEFQKLFPTVEFPPCPAQGNFDVREVLTSTYFFN